MSTSPHIKKIDFAELIDNTKLSGNRRCADKLIIQKKSIIMKFQQNDAETIKEDL